MSNNSNLIVLTGAGLSAPSGIKTFRDTGGLWEGHDVDTVCNITTFKRNHKLVHNFYSARRAELVTAQPNRGHEMIAKWKADYGERVTVLTQNVDDLLERAGCTDVIHLHGFIKDMQCLACGHHWDVGYDAWDAEHHRCPDCNSLKGVKPGVVFFGENAPRYADLYRAFRNIKGLMDTVVIIGTSGEVLAINSLVGARNGYATVKAFSILNNLAPSEAIDETLFNIVLHKSVADAADEMDALIKTRMSA